VGIRVNGHEHALEPDDVQLVMRPLEGYELQRSGTHAVALNLELDDDLRREGLAREVVHRIQNARKDAGLDVEDRIVLRLGGDPELLAAVRAHEAYVAGETLAVALDQDAADGGVLTEVEGRELRIAVERSAEA
jgi:isoleucyl-tRNA synthetase